MEEIMELVHNKITELNLQLYEKNCRIELNEGELNNEEDYHLELYKKQGTKETVHRVLTGHIAEIMLGLYVFDAQINPEDKILH